MELDDFKNKKAEPDLSEPGMNDIVEAFKMAQNKHRKNTKYLIAVLMFLSLIYLSRSIAEVNIISTGYALLVTGILAGALYLLLRYKPLPDTVFTLPMTDFIDKAEDRLKYVSAKDLVIILPILAILGTGGGMVFTSLILKYWDNFNLLLAMWIVFFVSLVIFGFWAGKKDWMKEHGRLLDELRGMRKNFTNEG